MAKFKLVLIASLAALSACANPPAPQNSVAIHCNDSQLICYRGFVIDRRATRDRYGVQGQHAINRSEYDL